MYETVKNIENCYGETHFSHFIFVSRSGELVFIYQILRFSNGLFVVYT